MDKTWTKIKNKESFSTNSYSPFGFHDVSLTSLKIWQLSNSVVVFLCCILGLGLLMKNILLLWLVGPPRKKNIQKKFHLVISK